MTYTVKVEENKELGYFIQLPDTLLNTLGWREDDNIEWVDNKNGSFTLKKIIYNNTQTKGAIASHTVNYNYEVRD
jgi:hypothetical protein